MKTSSYFVVVEHKAVKAGLHYDLRFKLPASNKWASFAVRKGVPLSTGKKVLAVRTKEHSREEALFTGTIKAGEYGAGTLKKWDGGSCIILKYSKTSMTIDFKGSKVKGIYHLISTGVIDKDFKKPTFMLFKGKIINETGMKSRIPSRGEICDAEEGSSEDVAPTMFWSKEVDNLYEPIRKLPWTLEKLQLVELFKPKKPLSRIKHLKIINKLDLDKDKTLIIGSAVLVLHGVIEKNHDLDLVVTRDVLSKLTKKKGIVKDYKFNKVFYKTKSGSMEAAVNFQVMHTTTEKLLKRALDVEGYKFMSLKDTYKMYKILNRPKDKEKLDRLKKIFH
jgi:DNA ligase D-like protein (predicted 3'-phosphoesterase)